MKTQTIYFILTLLQTIMGKEIDDLDAALESCPIVLIARETYNSSTGHSNLEDKLQAHQDLKEKNQIKLNAKTTAVINTAVAGDDDDVKHVKYVNFPSCNLLLSYYVS